VSIAVLGLLFWLNVLTFEGDKQFLVAVHVATRFWVLLSLLEAILRIFMDAFLKLSRKLGGLFGVFAIALSALPWPDITGSDVSGIVGGGFFVAWFWLWSRTSKVPPAHFVRVNDGASISTQEDFVNSYSRNTKRLASWQITDPRGNIITEKEALRMLNPEYSEKHA
jgi:hypothetical protein